MALTREPSARRASTMGEDSSTRRPIAETMRSMMLIRWASSRNCTEVSFENAAALDVDVLVGVDQNIGNGGIGEQRLERAETENFVENFLRKALAFLQVHGRGFADDQSFENLRHFAANIFALHFASARSRFSF